MSKVTIIQTSGNKSYLNCGLKNKSSRLFYNSTFKGRLKEMYIVHVYFNMEMEALQATRPVPHLATKERYL